MSWLKDFEKKAFTLLLVGFIWTASWFIVVATMIVAFDLPSNFFLTNVFSIIALAGFLFFQTWMILTISKGLYKQMFVKDEVNE